MDVIDKILMKLGASVTARAIYIDLLKHGSSNARTIAQRLSMTRPSVYDQLKELRALQLTVERDIDGKTEFAIHNVSDLGRMIETEKEKLETLSLEFAAIQKILTEKLTKKESVEPKIKFLAGGESILRAMHDMLWDESVTLYVVWPYSEMIRVFGEKPLQDFNKKRIRNGIEMHSVWSLDPKEKKNAAHIWEKEDWGVERRIAPGNAVSRMGYTIYDSKVLCISSRAEAFGFVVQSEDFADLMRFQFSLLWQASKRSLKK